ncbi:MAG: hypothetical protein JST12_19385 [Armatimonadetes bacterium]|nr:hypothetical protein [Armatimonadota bacterium]MBS1703836.1 hypothetical protein [Armatimonadota bacterium]
MLKGLNLSLLIGPLVPLPVPKNVVDALVSAQVTVSATDRSGFQLQFHFSKKSTISSAMIPAGYFDPGNRVILVATVNGLPTVLSDGIITRQDVVPSNVPGGSTVTVTGEDISLLMALVDLTGLLDYPAMPSTAIAALALAKYAAIGIIPAIIPDPFVDIKLPTTGYITHKGTDFDFIKKLATDSGYVFYTEPGPVPGTNIAYWGPEVRFGPIQKALNINMDAETNVESLSFNFDGLLGTNQIALIQEPHTGIPIPVPIPSLSILAPPLAARPATKLKVSFVRDVANLSIQGAMKKALKIDKESSDAVQGSGTLDVLRYGSILKARSLVGVRGAGTAYDGLYYVKSVTHNLKPGEFKQQFSLVRNGLISITPAVPA